MRGAPGNRRSYREPRSAYAGMQLPAEYIESRGASHWGLVLNRRLLPDLSTRVADWLDVNAT